MDSYVITLTISVTLLAVAASWQHKQTSTSLQLIPQTELHQFDIIDNELHDFERDTTADRFYSFRNQFLLVYGLVMAADWLQVGFDRQRITYFDLPAPGLIHVQRLQEYSRVTRTSRSVPIRDRLLLRWYQCHIHWILS